MTTATATQAAVKYDAKAAHQRYKLADGTPVPGVTTVLGVINKPQLLSWAWQCGMNGEDYRKVRDSAASAGTLAHWLIECHIKGLTPDLSEFAPATVSAAENAYLKWLDWWQGGGFEFAASESQLVHPDGYGGTLDILASRKCETCLIDLKTSKAIYSEHWYQVAAYGALAEANGVGPVKHYIICRIGKKCDDGDWSVEERSDVSSELAVFKAALGLYTAIKACR